MEEENKIVIDGFPHADDSTTTFDELDKLASQGPSNYAFFVVDGDNKLITDSETCIGLAAEKGLEPLALAIFKQDKSFSPAKESEKYINSEDYMKNNNLNEKIDFNNQACVKEKEIISLLNCDSYQSIIKSFITSIYGWSCCFFWRTRIC